MADIISTAIRESIRVKEAVLQDKGLLEKVGTVSKVLTDAYHAGNKVLFCGNGGSAADAQHLAAELSGRFYYDREPLFAEALHVNTSYLTAVANDYGYEFIYARLVKAVGRKGDVLIGLTTSGNSPNILGAVETAKTIGMVTVGMTGASGGRLKDRCDYLLNMPSSDTPRIQEAHMLLGHILCQIVEANLFPKP